MIDVTCPKCGVELEVADSKAGARITCPDCETRIAVPARTATKAARPPARPAASRAAAPPPRGKRPPRRRDEDDYDDEDSGTKGKLILGLSLAGVAVLCIVGAVLFFVLRGKDSKDKKEVVEASAPAAPITPEQLKQHLKSAGGPAPAPPVANPNPNPGPVGKPKEPPEKKPSTRPVGAAEPTAQEVSHHVLKSTVLILVNTPGGIASGSGSLIDAKNRLVLTNFHVVMNSAAVAVLFPIYDDQDRVVHNLEAYVKKLNEQRDTVRKAQVVAQDNKRDLALIQLAEVPNDVLPLAVAEKGVVQGDTVHSFGNPGAADMVWVSAKGEVRAVSIKHKWQAGDGHGQALNLVADVILTDSPTNPGDSGGPLVNGRGELVGVTHGGAQNARGLSLFIDRGEVVDFIESYCRSRGLAWDRADRHLEGGGPGEADLPTLVGDLKSDKVEVRSRAAQLLGAMGPKAKLAVGDLSQLLQDPEPLPRRVALSALARIGPEASPAAGALIDILKKDNDATVREEAAKVLAKIGPAIKGQAFGPLAKVLDDPVRGVRLAAVEAIASLGPLEAGDLPVVLKVLKDGGDDEIKGYAAKALGQFSSRANDIVPALVEAYKGTKTVKLQAALLESLAHFGDEAKVALPQLSDALKSGRTELVRPASKAVAGLGAEAQKLVPELTSALDTKDPATRREVLGVLVKVGPQAKEAVPALTRVLGEKDDRDARVLALSVLEQLGKDAKPAVQAMTLLFAEFQDKDLEAKAIAVLTKLGKEAVPDLRISLRNSNPRIRLGVCKALGSIGPAARAAAGDLRALAQTDIFIPVTQEAERAYWNVTRKP